ncbi:MAG TPA: M90 family metallopeptidase [Pirellulales bacterium]|jgi:hypothetical protein|nr:M90 family metallopeptidase [Pirellulales bacterium]
MIFRWLKHRRRQAILAGPFPPAWDDILRQRVRLYGTLMADEQARVRDYLRVFVAEKNWEGCSGQTITDEVQVTVAALVAILVLGFDDEYFSNVLSILVYPDAYLARRAPVLHRGLVLEEDSPREGEAWYRGPVVLSWADVEFDAGPDGDGRNLVLHEFAHQLDMLNGRTADGLPPMGSAEQERRWAAVVEEEFDRLVGQCERGNPTLLDCYAATNRAEFFAVATETFFERPTAMLRRMPALYEILREFYRQDPASRRQPGN